MQMGFLWNVINTSSSLYSVNPSFVNMETLPLLAFLSTFIMDAGNSLNMSASAALLESYGNSLKQ